MDAPCGVCSSGPERDAVQDQYLRGFVVCQPVMSQCMRHESALVLGPDTAQYRQGIGKGGEKGPQGPWLPRSCVKLRRSLGPIWPAASDRTAMVFEQTVPTTPMVDDATAPSRVRVPVSPPLQSQRLRSKASGKTPLRSISTELMAPTIPAITIRPRMIQKRPFLEGDRDDHLLPQVGKRARAVEHQLAENPRIADRDD